MNDDYEVWPTASPPDGFAERTARTILAPAPVRRRWVRPATLFLAAALLAGGAWATVELTRPAPRLTEEGANVLTPRAHSVRVHAVETPAASVAPPHAKPPRPRPVAAKPEEPAAPKKVIPPPPPPSCDCGPGAIVCTCRSETTRAKETP